MDLKTSVSECTGEGVDVRHQEGGLLEEQGGITTEREVIMAEALQQFRKATKKVADEVRTEVAKRRPFHQALEVMIRSMFHRVIIVIISLTFLVYIFSFL